MNKIDSNFKFRLEIIQCHHHQKSVNCISYEVLSTPLDLGSGSGSGSALSIDDYFFNLDDNNSKILIEETFAYIKQFHNVCISVNINKSMIINQNNLELLYQNISLLPKENNLKIALEINERCCNIVQSEEFERHILNVKKLGVQVWLDDFGTGEANLASITSDVFDVIKIDKSIFWELYGQSQNLLIEMIKYFIEILDKRVIIEGVENIEQLSFVFKHKCSAQGYILRNND